MSATEIAAVKMFLPERLRATTTNLLPVPEVEPTLRAVVFTPTAMSGEYGLAISDFVAEHLAGSDIVVAVIPDDYLGNEDADLVAAGNAGAALTLIRSLAVSRDTPRRANAVATSRELLGGSASVHRGPGRPPTAESVAEAVAYLLSPGGRYVSGQTLFVNGGRHLFSSMSA